MDTAATPASGWHAAWERALDALELEVSTAEALLADDHRNRDYPAPDPWQPPGGIGPLPLDLRPRADGILARQLAVAEAITRLIAQTRAHAEYAARVDDDGHPPPRPAYIDCSM